MKAAATQFNRDKPCRSDAHAPAFTLIEMMVVVAVILIILGIALPAASSLWEERKAAETVNTIQGLLMTSRARAMQADAVETGFLAYVDSQGTQHLVSIEQRRDKLSDPNWSDVFVIGEYPEIDPLLARRGLDGE